MAGLTSSGYLARTAGEWFDVAKVQYNKVCADLGVSAPRYDKAEFTTVVLMIVAQIASEIDNAVAALFDQHDPNQASGFLLRLLAMIAGVVVDDGSKSRATLTVTAWANGPVVLTKGETKASDGTNSWVALEDVLIPAGGNATGVFETLVSGPTIALAGTINKRQTGVAGWQTVTNAADATPGSFPESDASIRNRIALGQGGTGSRSELAVHNAILRMNGVRQVRVVYNPLLVPATVSSRVIPENGVAVWVYPDTLTGDVQGNILSLMFSMIGGNVQRSLPTETGVDGVRGSIVGADERPHLEGFWYMNQSLFRIDVLIDAFEPGGTLDKVTVAVQGVIRAYFAGLVPGAAIRRDDLVGLVASVPGVARSTVTMSVNGGGFSGSDVVLDPATFALINSAALSQGVVVHV